MYRHLLAKQACFYLIFDMMIKDSVLLKSLIECFDLNPVSEKLKQNLVTKVLRQQIQLKPAFKVSHIRILTQSSFGAFLLINMNMYMTISV